MINVLNEDERKALRYEKRLGYTFAGVIVCAGVLANLFYFEVFKKEYNLAVGLVDACIPFLAGLVCWALNRDLNRDLKENFKEIQTKKIDKLIAEKYYPVGDIKLVLPNWTRLVTRIMRIKLSDQYRYYILTGENRYMISKELYESLKNASDFMIHLAPHSETVLGFSKAE
jgi:hypothetical protein